MHRPGSDPADMRMEDVLCDFCGRPWADGVPMVEGHRGSCICGRCLTVAYAELVLHRRPTRVPGDACTLCLVSDDAPGWVSPVRAEAVICQPCAKRAAGVLHKDPDWAWSKPQPEADRPPAPEHA